ncbi:helix-turn-helix domain-containing protein [Listeria booriae]|uniref:helix-turn-helix domain-containing protein n=1 Tax=Listeria booriae TaxID=1552123 RepID=UPI0035E3CC87
MSGNYTRKSIREIALDIGRAPSTVSREMKQNTIATSYSANQAQQNYVCELEACRRKKIIKLSVYQTQSPLFTSSPSMVPRTDFEAIKARRLAGSNKLYHYLSRDLYRTI